MRWYLSIWLTSIALVGIGLGVLGLHPSPVVPADLVLPRVPVVLIGSSLLNSGIPSSGSAEDSLLGDGRPHIRLAIKGIAETEALELARLAIEAGSKTILIEIFPFCRDFANKVAFDPQKEHRPIAWARIILLQSRQLLKTFNRRVLGHSARTSDVSAFMKDPAFGRGPKRERYALSELYPLDLHQPVEAAQLTKVLALAKSNGVEVYFLAPPRSELAARFQGDAAMAAQDAHARAVADRFGIGLIEIGPVWPDTDFSDQGHVNLAGRERFVQELRNWWTKHHGA